MIPISRKKKRRINLSIYLQQLRSTRIVIVHCPKTWSKLTNWQAPSRKQKKKKGEKRDVFRALIKRSQTPDADINRWKQAVIEAEGEGTVMWSKGWGKNVFPLPGGWSSPPNESRVPQLTRDHIIREINRFHGKSAYLEARRG